MACTAEEFSSLTVPELKSMLKSRGMPVSGKKAELIERLEAGSSGASTDRSGAVAAPRKSLLKRNILKRTTEDVPVPVEIARSRSGDEASEEDYAASFGVEEDRTTEMDRDDYNDPLDALIALGGTVLGTSGKDTYSELPSGGFSGSREYESTRKHWKNDSRLADKPDHSGKSDDELRGEIQALIKERTTHRDIKHYREADEIRDRLRFEYEVEIYDYQGKWEGPNGIEGPTPRNK